MHNPASNRLGEQMFSIDERNKIRLTIGDTASFTCTITDLDDDIVTPVPENTLTFYIDDIGFSKQAVIDNSQYVFIIAGSDTLDLESGVYLYRVVLDMNGAQYTIFQDDFIELLGDKEKSDPEPEPEPEPTPAPEHYHKFEGWVSNNDGTHTGYCDCGDTIIEQCEFSGGICPKCRATDPDYVPDQSSEGDNP